MAAARRVVLLFFTCFLCQSWGFYKDASEPHVVFPLRVDSKGHVISQDVTAKYHHESSGSSGSDRVKRETADNHIDTDEGDEGDAILEELYIKINNNDEELFLKLTQNTKLITPYTVIEWVLEDGRRILKQATGDCFYVGRLQDAEQSLVAISNCDGLTGYIQTQNESYFIEPLKGSRPPRPGHEEDPQPHLIYKVESITRRLNLSLQQDQEFQDDPSITKDIIDEDATFVEMDDLFRKKRSVILGVSKPWKMKKLRDVRTIKAKRRRRRSLPDLPGIPARSRRSPEDVVPKFRRERRPKFSRRHDRPITDGDKQSWSSGIWRPKFFPFVNATDENERQKRDGSSETTSGERSLSIVSRNNTIITKTVSGDLGRRGAGSSGRVDPHENEIDVPDRKEKKKKKKKKKKSKKDRKGCKKRKNKNMKGGAHLDKVSDDDGDEDDDSGTRCKPRKSKKKLSKAEREKRRQERKERKRKKREQKKKERERKKLLREKQKQERRKKRGKKMVEGDQEEVITTTTTTTPKPEEEKGPKDPFEGEQWDGYSPDLFWETDIAAGSSALPEVSFGPTVNVTDPPKWLELVVAVDHTVIDFHGDDEVEKYVFTLFNIVSAIYEDPSLESSMELVMLRIIFYKDEDQSQVQKGLAKRSLEAVNRWAERLHRVSPQHLRHDLAVWLTKSDLGGPSGYAPVSGVCQPSRSCTLNRDEGLTSAFIIAHEMGHVLGLSHDGDRGAGNSCQDEGFQGSIMAPLVAATFSRFHWSKCSKQEYHSRARNWSCMKNKPQWKNATTISSSIQYQFSLDDQCRMEFGEGYALCRSFGMTDPCTHLWCSNSSTPHLCKTKKGPPLEGTSCGEQKWCRNGFCESTIHDDSDGQPPVRHNPQDGGWSDWSDWGPCSRTCGTGVSFKTRACDNPAPAWGGRRCRGKREEWKLCGIEECPPPRHDFRAQQCHLLNRIANLDPRRAALSWQPYEPKKRRKKCRISCYSHDTNEVYIGREYVIDGTPCSYDVPDDVCVQGKCISVGCDKLIGSRARRDKCGICGGDGGTCTQHNLGYNEIPPIDYNIVTVLPIGARNVVVREESATMNFIALTDNSSSYILNGDQTQEPDKSFISQGAKFQYSSHGEREMLQAAGPLLSPLTVMVHGSTAQENVRVTTSFYTPLKEEYYQWEIGPYTACSVTCGGGQRHQTLVCRDRRSDLQVFHHRCRHLERPELNSTSCNTFGCETKWMSGPWEHCSATCGLNGVQERIVSCVTLPHAHYKNWTDGIVDPIQCRGHPKPETTRECRREPCPADWEPIGWGECSVTCGVGEQEQLWECTGSSGNEVTYDCGYRPKLMRACIKPSCPPSPCLKDASEFCQLPVLYKYCKVPKYNALCCHTCANVVH